MALKARIKKTAYDKLSDELKAEYKADGEEYVLDVEGAEDTGALKRANDRLRQENKDLKTERDELADDNRKLESGKAGDVKKLTNAHEAKLKEVNEASAASLNKANGFITKSLKTGTAERIAAALNPKAPKIFVPHLEARITVDLTGDEPKIVILGADGKPGMIEGKPMTADQLQQEFVANKDFAGMIVGSKASGGAGAAGTGLRGGAPASGSGNQQPPSLATMKPGDLAATLKERIEARGNN
jgi:hypothetical protein